MPKNASNDTDMDSESSDSDEDGGEDGGSGAPVLQAIFCFCLIMRIYNLTFQLFCNKHS